MQMAALGIEDLVERPVEPEDEQDESDAPAAELAPEETSEDAPPEEEVSETEADASIGLEVADETETAEAAIADEQPDTSAEWGDEPEPATELEPETAEVPPAEAEPEGDHIEALEEASDASPDADEPDDSEPVQVVVEAEIVEITADDGSAGDSTESEPEPEPEAEHDAELLEEGHEPDEDEPLELAEADLELDDLQLTALGIDVPAHENGHASNGTVVLDGTVDEWPAADGASEPQCPNGHENPEGSRFCLQCGAPLQAGCPHGHENPPGAAFCGECGANLRSGTAAKNDDATALQLREEAVRVAAETLRRMQEAQQAEVEPLLREVGSLSALASDQRVLPLRKSLHEQHITVKRAEMALVDAQREAGAVSGEEADLLTALRQTELDFAIQMLLEVTELIALPGNDEEGRELVRQHMSGIFTECDERRRAALLALAQVRGEPHAIRSAELESDLAGKSAEARALREKSKPNQAEIWRVEGECLGLRVTQLAERRAAAIARADVDGTDEADLLLAKARDRAKDHADHAPVRAQKMSRFVAEMMTGMPTVFTGGQRVPRSADRRVGSAKRAVAEFRDFFDTHPAPAIGVADKLLDQLAGDWEEYSTSARMFVGAPMVVQGRSGQRAKIQWIKYDQMILNAWVRRVAVVSSELAVSEAAGDEDRSEGMRMLLEVATEAVRLSSAAAKVEVPTV